MTDGAVIRLRRHGFAAGPRFVLSHGNGFAIDGYAAFWTLLTQAFDVVLFDLRNHGQNPRHVQADHRLTHIVRDVATIRTGIDEAFGKKPATGVFHSISAIAAILAAREGVAWDALILVDPPLALPPGHPLREAQVKLDEMLGAWAERRPDDVGTLDAYAADLEGARPYSRCVPGAARAMAAATTRETSAGGRELCVPGRWESAIYRDNSRAGSYAALGGLDARIWLVGGDPDLKGAASPALATSAAAAEFSIPWVAIPGASHLLQIEQPRATVNAALTFLGLPEAAA